MCSSDLKGEAAGDFTSHLRKRDSGGVITGEHHRRWKDLQLPVYHRALLPTLPTAPASPDLRPRLEIGYLCLPANSRGTKVELWSNYDEDFAAAAGAILDLVTSKISSGASAAFQPSAQGSDYPLLPALATRPTASYLNVAQLGGTRA